MVLKPPVVILIPKTTEDSAPAPVGPQISQCNALFTTL